MSVYLPLPQVTVPPGISGDWRVEDFAIGEAEAEFHNLREFMNRRRRKIVAGTYTRLTYQNDIVVMSDTPAEMHDHLRFVHRARGRVLITGLGLGMVLQAVAQKPNVARVDVVELSADVIALVGPHYREMFGDKLKIHHADAQLWRPTGLMHGQRFNAVWHDIWPVISGKNWPSMTRLHRRYAHWLTPSGFQDSWMRDEVRRLARS